MINTDYLKYQESSHTATDYAAQGVRTSRLHHTFARCMLVFAQNDLRLFGRFR